ncbi:S49 family peptidase [Planktomarina temperata]|nr:S49 family peptidase [Planktomarina temperata]
MKLKNPFRRDVNTVCVVRLNGMISTGRGLNDAGLAPVLQKAFAKKPAAVALSINSPGGSPVQSSLIGARIRRLAQEFETPVYAFVEDVAASGGYWLAASADEIYIDASSVVGSIGVISSGFGLNQFIERHGIERRVHTAGSSKSMLDPFQPQKKADVTRLKSILDGVHQTFKDHIIDRRGAKLAERDLFTGEIWIGQKAIDDGLADAIGHLVPTMKGKFGEKTRFRVLGQKKPLLSRFGMSLLSDVTHSIEERAAFARFGM